MTHSLQYRLRLNLRAKKKFGKTNKSDAQFDDFMEACVAELEATDGIDDAEQVCLLLWENST